MPDDDEPGADAVQHLVQLLGGRRNMRGELLRRAAVRHHARPGPVCPALGGAGRDRCRIGLPGPYLPVRGAGTQRRRCGQLLGARQHTGRRHRRPGSPLARSLHAGQLRRNSPGGQPGAQQHTALQQPPRTRRQGCAGRQRSAERVCPGRVRRPAPIRLTFAAAGPGALLPGQRHRA